MLLSIILSIKYFYLLKRNYHLLLVIAIYLLIIPMIKVDKLFEGMGIISFGIGMVYLVRSLKVRKDENCFFQASLFMTIVLSVMINAALLSSEKDYTIAIITIVFVLSIFVFWNTIKNYMNHIQYYEEICGVAEVEKTQGIDLKMKAIAYTVFKLGFLVLAISIINYFFKI